MGSNPYTVQKGERIAQLILEHHATATIVETNSLPPTKRSSKGFGSTGQTTVVPHITPTNSPEKTNEHAHIIPPDEDNERTVINNLTNACDIQMEWSEPVYTTSVLVPNTGSHPTRGIQVQKDDKGLLIINCTRGTPSARIPQWRTTLKNSTILSVDNMTIRTFSDLQQAFANADGPEVTMTVIPAEPVSIHDETGIPQMNFDQFIHVAAKHQNVLDDPVKFLVDEETDDISQIEVSKLTTKSLTRAKLLKQTDWPQWEQSEFLQLNQYERQNMFSKPGPIPSDVCDPNILPMIWVYIIKVDGRYKARCVANGAPHLKGSLTIANTYAACLEQSGCRMFWCICAIKNLIIYGADAANAFAEAPPPKSRLFLKVDAAYRNWWHNKSGEHLPPESYVECFHAIQGHPESPRLWQLHIDKILRLLGFSSSQHEPCIYISLNGKFGETEILLLRQVDDFAVACRYKDTATKIRDALDAHLSEPLKRETGYVTRHNGIDILQTRHFIRVHCATYIAKIISDKPFSFDNIHQRPIPLHADSKHIEKLETASTSTPSEILMLEQKHGFKYRTATGELIFAMVTCRTDIGFSVMKLSQFNNRPSDCHFDAIKDVFRYLSATRMDGLTYWRPEPNMELPIVDFPIIPPESYSVQIPKQHNLNGIAYCYADSDWASDRQTRRSVSGIAIMMNGATIIYKTILQRTVALSSTEAEFYALAEAGKIVLYMRSVLSDINVPQTLPTVIYEDNRGCLKMTQAMKPTKRTRHVDTRYFAILDWIQTDNIEIAKIDTADNASDALTKALGRVLFYRHNATLLGHRIPTYVEQ